MTISDAHGTAPDRIDTAGNAPGNRADLPGARHRTYGRSTDGVAGALEPLVSGLLGGRVPVRVEFWDGSTLGPMESPDTLHVRSAEAIRHLVWAPNELGVGRAYVSGAIDVGGDVWATMAAIRDAAPSIQHAGLGTIPTALGAARRIGAVGRRPPIPPEEARPSGLRHTKGRDAEAISHHYDVSNDFYELVLGPSMTYSCARFPDESNDLTTAQASKHELICRKLGLHERSGARLLDVGCGWGSMAIHAAVIHRARVVGVTISHEQARRARERVEKAGVADLVEIRVQDYRDVAGETFDAISSIGMAEHVGSANMVRYFETLHAVLAPKGRLLNHAISSVGGSTLSKNSFVYRYVFPDGELLDVAATLNAMQEAGFEVRDAESLREHYAHTLRAWVGNLERHWERAVALVGEGRARVWRLYMVGSALGFEGNGLAIHQVLGVATGRDGDSAMPRTRDAWTTRAAR